MKKIIIINGPNLNLLGKREPTVYGTQSFESYFESLKEQFGGAIVLEYFQSNHEGAIIDKLHEVGFSYDGIVLNGGAYTHTSIAIADAIAAINTAVVEVHISNVYAREAFRHHSYFSANCKGLIVGLGLQGYSLAILSFVLGTNANG
ncbi:MAG: type II 3-dehydroquinate dehydratase [Saprospiraceae bacterium]|nr:type II 3-dehydroquinate dehydratase [Saprospiraceae bacterium]